MTHPLTQDPSARSFIPLGSNRKDHILKSCTATTAHTDLKDLEGNSAVYRATGYVIWDNVLDCRLVRRLGHFLPSVV
jgi:hypothetical protein